jgi:glycosyltransferase involved in cell wall biosynthesis
MSLTANSLWLTWEDHRRSRELADALSVEYVALQSSLPRIGRYPILAYRTVAMLVRSRPDTVFCQNPSIVLSALVCLLKGVLDFKVCIDRHSNFKPETARSRKPIWKLFHLLSKWTVKKADLTIVTNDFLSRLVSDWGGRPYVLQDRMPSMSQSSDGRAPDFMTDLEKTQVMFVTTFSDDEPLEAVFEAKSQLHDCIFYLTGNYQKAISASRRTQLAQTGTVLTGFVTDQDYVDLMAKADVVVVLTTKENLLTCGAYEAMAMGKPMVLSGTAALREYFRRGAAYVGNDSDSIAQGVQYAIANRTRLAKEIEEFVPVLEAQWQARFEGLLQTLDSTASQSGRTNPT